MNLNKVTIAGRLSRDPESKFTPKGTAVCQFAVAINRKWKSEAGEIKEEVTFLDCEAWGKTAESLAQYHRKGSDIYCEGRMKVDSWDDKETGKKRSKVMVVVESWQFCGGKRDEGPAQSPAAAPRAAAPKAPSEADPMNPDKDEDDVPF